jgi:murein L,D-transpeptidase YcbB/YkuD
MNRILQLSQRPIALFWRSGVLASLLASGVAAQLCWLLLARPAFAQQVESSPPGVASAAPADELAAIDMAALDIRTRTAVAASLARWQALGPLPRGRWLLVNIPAYEIRLFDGVVVQARWRAIIGKPKTPTPTFRGTANGVILNPWWEVPASIVAESVGRLVARNPKRAAAQGYVREGTRYRQAPGPDNQLGRIKLDFRNAHSVGIHDTPSRQLFARERRALSHGCIRVDDALGFAATLLGPPASRDSLTAVIETSRETRAIGFETPVPVIVGYFTAEVSPSGALVLHEDIYRMDTKSQARTVGNVTECLLG